MCPPHSQDYSSKIQQLYTLFITQAYFICTQQIIDGINTYLLWITIYSTLITIEAILLQVITFKRKINEMLD